MIVSGNVAVYSQTVSDYDTTCATLARLTEAASKQSNVVEMIVYIRAAVAIRERLQNTGSCEAKYFAAVVAANATLLGSASVVLTADVAKPVRGWTHREVDDFITILEKYKPRDFFDTIRSGQNAYELRTDYDKLLKDVTAIKKRYPVVQLNDQ
jgi:hypothetical protein